MNSPFVSRQAKPGDFSKRSKSISPFLNYLLGSSFLVVFLERLGKLVRSPPTADAQAPRRRTRGPPVCRSASRPRARSGSVSIPHILRHDGDVNSGRVQSLVDGLEHWIALHQRPSVQKRTQPRASECALQMRHERGLHIRPGVVHKHVVILHFCTGSARFTCTHDGSLSGLPCIELKRHGWLSKYLFSRH